MSDLPPPAAAGRELPIPAILALVIFGLFALCIIGAFLTKNAALLNTLVEALKATVFTVAGFYFGSAIGSRSKDAVIASLQAKTDA